ncbi:hypothetical protein TCAL_17386 [Tigriopus californicus]|uniref:Uncharacterized protein n=1 Tax=Tigriopus californicus TaxID=6832 RepID=A0A553NS72_TIGCA|nr:hypothetical protein TCAL_17386 [Tigriopus californicus]
MAPGSTMGPALLTETTRYVTKKVAEICIAMKKIQSAIYLMMESRNTLPIAEPLNNVIQSQQLILILAHPILNSTANVPIYY